MTQFELLEPGDAPETNGATRRRGRPAKASSARYGADSGTAKAGKAAKNGKGELGFEAKLWQAADALRGSMDASEYKHIVLGLIFLKYISDAFEERHGELLAEVSDPESPMYLAEEKLRYDFLEERDEYTAENVFWVPKEARWSFIRDNARKPNIGVLLDEAMTAIEKDNQRLKGVLPKVYALPNLDRDRLGRLIDIISGIGLGDAESKSKDILGRVYEYFLGQFASNEGKKGGEFYTPRHVVRLLVEMLAPKPGSRIFDPCCGSGGMFVQSEKFVEEHGGRLGDVSIYGQETNQTTWRLCQMNLAIRGIEANIAWNTEGSFHKDAFPDLKADYILANPPFNVSDWGGERLRSDVRWKYGVPPVGNANFAWVQHFIHHLAPNGVAEFVLANGSMAAGGAEGEIRRAIIEDDRVDCIVALPGQLFYSVTIPVCLWFVTRDKRSGPRDRTGEALFIDARSRGTMVDRIHRELRESDIRQIADAYHRWRQGDGYSDEAGFCKSARLDEIRQQGHVLTPGRYTGSSYVPDESEGFEERLTGLVGLWSQQRARAGELDQEIASNLGRLSVV